MKKVTKSKQRLFAQLNLAQKLNFSLISKKSLFLSLQIYTYHATEHFMKLRLLHDVYLSYSGLPSILNPILWIQLKPFYYTKNWIYIWNLGLYLHTQMRENIEKAALRINASLIQINMWFVENIWYCSKDIVLVLAKDRNNIIMIIVKHSYSWN